MVYILAVENNLKLQAAGWQKLLEGLPPKMQQRIHRYRRWQDRQATLFGKYLLRYGLANFFGDTDLFSTYQLDTYQRPFIGGDVDFNISHSDGMVVCALGRSTRLGIDIERLKKVDPQEFTIVFTREEYQHITQSQNPTQSFFTIWTRKEAAMKADGRGFFLQPRSIDVLQKEKVVIDQQIWTLQQIPVSDRFCCHLATREPSLVTYRQIQASDFL